MTIVPDVGQGDLLRALLHDHNGLIGPENLRPDFIEQLLAGIDPPVSPGGDWYLHSGGLGSQPDWLLVDSLRNHIITSVGAPLDFNPSTGDLALTLVRGDLITAITGFNVPATLAIGAAGEVLQSDGSDVLWGPIPDSLSIYRNLISASAGIHDLQASMTGFMIGGGLGASGTAFNLTENVAVPLLYLDDADYAVTGKTTKLRVRAELLTNDTGIGITVTPGLYPVTSDFGSGNDQLKLTLGTVVSGSTVAFSSPSADSENQGNSGDFTFPSDGYYVLGVVLSGAPGTNSRAMLSVHLQLHHV